MRSPKQRTRQAPRTGFAVKINPDERDGLLKLDAALAKLAKAAWAAHPNNPKNKKRGAK